MSNKTPSIDIAETASRARTVAEIRARLAEETREQLQQFALQGRDSVEHMPGADINLYGPGREANFKLLMWRAIPGDPDQRANSWTFEGVAIHKRLGEIFDFRSAPVVGFPGETPHLDELLEWAPQMRFSLESTTARQSTPYTPVFPLDDVFNAFISASIRASERIARLETETAEMVAVAKVRADRAASLRP